MVASVPELTIRTRSMPGMIRHKALANSVDLFATTLTWPDLDVFGTSASLYLGVEVRYPPGSCS